MAQAQVLQEADYLASLHELGVLQEEYDNYHIGGLLSCLALIMLIPVPFFIVFLSITFQRAGPWNASFAIITVITVLWILSILSTLRLFYLDRHSRRFLYTHGLVLVKCRGQQIIASEAIHWRDIATIWREVRVSKGHRHTSRSMVHTLQRSNGEIFGKTFEKAMRNGVNSAMHRASKQPLGTYIEQMTLPYMLPAAMKALEQGEPVSFGPLSLQANGIHYQNDFLPWEFFERLVEDNNQGQLLILPKPGQTLPGGKKVWATIPSTSNSNVAYLHRVRIWAAIPYKEVPNPALFVHLAEALSEPDLPPLSQITTHQRLHKKPSLSF